MEYLHIYFKKPDYPRKGWLKIMEEEVGLPQKILALVVSLVIIQLRVRILSGGLAKALNYGKDTVRKNELARETASRCRKSD